MLKGITRWWTKFKYSWSRQRCYDDREAAGHAAMGCCGGLVGGDYSTNYLQYRCMACPYCTHLDITTMPAVTG